MTTFDHASLGTLPGEQFNEEMLWSLQRCWRKLGDDWEVAGLIPATTYFVSHHFKSKNALIDFPCGLLVQNAGRFKLSTFSFVNSNVTKIT